MKITRYIQEGKSENYQDAEDKGLLKAGEAAALLTKKFGTKIFARELEAFSKEWHHGGVFKSGNSLKGRRVYFFSPGQLDKISLESILSKREKKAPVESKEVQGWFVQFFKMTDPVSRRVYSKPFVGVYKGPSNKKPKNFQPLSDEAFAIAQRQRGRALAPNERPEF